MASANYDNTDGRIRGRKLQERRLRLWKKSPHCASCGRLTDLSGPHCFNLDHKQPLFKGGEDKDSNCQVLCQPCHEVKTNDDLGRKNMIAFNADGWPA